jgi:hypothetical protein
MSLLKTRAPGRQLAASLSKRFQQSFNDTGEPPADSDTGVDAHKLEPKMQAYDAPTF